MKLNPTLRFECCHYFFCHLNNVANQAPIRLIQKLKKEILKTKPTNLDEFILGYCAREAMKQPQPTLNDYLNDLSVGGRRASGMSIIRGQSKESLEIIQTTDMAKTGSF